MLASIPFELRGLSGQVAVEYLVNEDPARWGYPILGIESLNVQRVRGCPVARATVEYPAEGYAAEMAWIQIVEQRTAPATDAEIVVDVAPQMVLAQAAMPYMAFGVRPTFFDAPGTDEPDYEFRAVAFLAASPDGLMTPVVGPLCGFRWGYRMVASEPTIDPLAPAGADDWAWVKAQLDKRYPRWKFLDAGWKA